MSRHVFVDFELKFIQEILYIMKQDYLESL